MNVRTTGVRRREARLATALAIVALALPGAGCRSGEITPPRAVVLVTIDTLRADHLGVYGYPRDTSPHLDRLASESIVFDDVMSPMATTLPSHVSLMTSTFPVRHGILTNFNIRRQGLKSRHRLWTLAERFRQAGWRTAAFVSATPIKQITGIGAGFDRFDQPKGSERSGTRTMERVFSWLGKRPKTPFFLWIHLFDPHGPYTPPPPFDRTFDRAPFPADWYRQRGFPPIDEGDNRETWDGYDAEVRFADEVLGRFFARLQELGLWNDILLVVTADHGEGLGQHGWWQHGEVHDEMLRVPLLLKLPADRHQGGRRRSQLASLVDLAPTLLAAAGVPCDAGARRQIQGSDLLAVPPRQYTLAERPSRHRSGWEPGRVFVLVTKRWKLIYRTAGDDELYDRSRDRWETENLAVRRPEIAERMLGRLTELRRELGAGLSPDAVGKLTDPERIEELRSLGYL